MGVPVPVGVGVGVGAGVGDGAGVGVMTVVPVVPGDPLETPPQLANAPVNKAIAPSCPPRTKRIRPIVMQISLPVCDDVNVHNEIVQVHLPSGIGFAIGRSVIGAKASQTSKGCSEARAFGGKAALSESVNRRQIGRP